MSEDTVQELVRVSSADFTYLQRAAAEHNVTVNEVPSRQVLEYAYEISCILAGSSVAVSRVMHLLDEGRGGQVIDLRPGVNDPIYRSRNVQYGLITIIGADGSVSIRRHELKTGVTSLLEALNHSREKSVDAGVPEIVKEIKNQLETDSEIVIVRNSDSRSDADR